MPSNRSSRDTSDSEDSEPEVLTLSSTKKSSRTQSEAVHAFERAQKVKRKRENRERDAALKEAKEARQAEHRAMGVEEERSKKRSLGNKKGKKEPGLSVTGEMSGAEGRMERAMREAAEEGSEGDSMEKGSDGWDGIDNAEEGVTATNTDHHGSEEWHGIASATTKHLPDHLFSTAAAQPTTSTPPSVVTPKPRKKRKQSKAKELIVGSRTICPLPSSHSDSLTASLTLPPARIKKFLKRTLHLRQSSGSESPNKKPNPQSWERRPANIGVMRHKTGPAIRFVRGAAV